MNNRLIRQLHSYGLAPGECARLGSGIDPSLTITIQGLTDNGVYRTLRRPKKASVFAVVHRRHSAERRVNGGYMPLIIWQVVYVFASGRCFVQEDITDVAGQQPCLPQRAFLYLIRLGQLPDGEFEAVLDHVALPKGIRVLKSQEEEGTLRALVEWQVIETRP